MRARRLVLKKETLAELRIDELTAVVGAAAVTTPVVGCLVTGLSDKLAACDSNLRPCISNTCTL